MKTLLLSFLFLAVGLQVSAQYEQSNTVELPGVSKDEMYNRAILWITKTFNSAKDVTQLQDKEAGKIIAKGSYRYNAPPFSPGTKYSGYFTYTITVDVKDGKYRYKIDELRHESTEGGMFSEGELSKAKKVKKHIGTEAAAVIKNLAADLEASMTKEYKDEKW